MIMRTLFCFVWFHSTASGAAWYVDNRAGSDDNDGFTQQTALATIARAVSLSQTGDDLYFFPLGQAPYGQPRSQCPVGAEGDQARRRVEWI